GDVLTEGARVICRGLDPTVRITTLGVGRISTDCPFRAGRARPGAAQNDAAPGSQPEHRTGVLCREHEHRYADMARLMALVGRGPTSLAAPSLIAETMREERQSLVARIVFATKTAGRPKVGFAGRVPSARWLGFPAGVGGWRGSWNMARTTPEHARACVDGVANVHSPCGPVRLCGSCFRGPALAPCR